MGLPCQDVVNVNVFFLTNAVLVFSISEFVLIIAVFCCVFVKNIAQLNLDLANTLDPFKPKTLHKFDICNDMVRCQASLLSECFLPGLSLAISVYPGRKHSAKSST